MAWPKGILNKAGAESTTYEGDKVEYSGYNGVNGQKGHEYIRLDR